MRLAPSEGTGLLRKVLVVVGVVLAIPLLVFLVQGIAAESGEVVVVRTQDSTGNPHETRLWVVDDDGASWLRAGTAAAGWLAHIERQPEIEVVRGDETLLVRGVPEPSRRLRTNELMREKYGWAYAYITFLFSRGDSVPIRLVPR
jgi:hypothetical protein